MKTIFTSINPFIRIIPVLLVMFLLFASRTSTSSRWKPTPLPTNHHGKIRAFILAIDGSKSMRQKQNLSPRTRSAAIYALNEQPFGTYVVLVTFGTKAQIITDKYLQTNRNRKTLKKAVEKIDMNDSQTDVHKLEILLNQTQKKLRKQFKNQELQLEIKILTDGKPDSIKDSPSATFTNLLGQQTSHVELGGGLHMFGIEFQYKIKSLNKATDQTITYRIVLVTKKMQQRLVTEFETKHQKSSVQKRHNATTVVNNKWVYYLIITIIITIVLITLCLTTLLSRCRKWYLEGKQILGKTHDKKTPSQSPTSISVTEWLVNGDDRQQVQGPQIVAYLPKIPLILGGDTTQCVLGLTTPDTPARLFQIVLDGKGTATVTPLNKKLLLDGKQITRPVKISAEEQHAITYDSIEIELEPANLLTKSEETLFGRTMAAKKIEPIIVAQ